MIMAVGFRSWLARPSLLRTLLVRLRLSVRLLRDPEVPLALKALPIAAAIYLASPLDFLPDVVPLLGQLDDVTVLLIGLEAFLKLAPTHLVDFHRRAMAGGRRYSPAPKAGNVIDAEFRRADK
jgi:uncharacterized membrane protein YkvA (DUF1232 family)